MAKDVKSTVEELIEPFLEKEGYELVDVEYVKEGKNRFLRIYIDKPEGVSLDDCKFVSGYIGEKLDELDPIQENYFLEVSSPGIDRKLKKDKDFKRFKGSDVEVRLYKAVDGEKNFEGELLGLFDGDIVKVKKGEMELELERKNIALIKLAVKF
ncbi:ribosome maturation factor RimP [Peptoclostridium litorale DSM 5388]|uniref:Ribosome maturation factor RimP n=1 Tax=Peptoclostridium litorale DSM 5388 TaxID=1121324 RepID=A0A069REJ7_PEPLI|nr:ribosome maturation factor RimP [Peptoclostridium litorale]KDR95203.1 ribosome maturation factor RimP [Peptoclostridium litorale DSM 5388]SIN73431.1 ribosome maturation factor RimP [Peptoclostridium litorale DSM 5388]